MAERYTSGRFTAFVAGAIAGAAFTFLTTPKTGRENRRILGNLGEKFLDELQDRYDENGDDIKKKGRDLMDRGQEYLNEKKKDLNEAIAAGSAAMEREKKELKKTIDPEFVED